MKKLLKIYKKIKNYCKKCKKRANNENILPLIESLSRFFIGADCAKIYM